MASFHYKLSLYGIIPLETIDLWHHSIRNYQFMASFH